MSSKKKKRNAEFLKREQKRSEKKAKDKRLRDAMQSDDIDKMAEAYGIRLN